MTLVEIENLTFAELKAKRAEAIESATVADSDELATRYVDARTNAKQRDEKLAEQGKTITLLQDSLERESQRASTAENACTVANNTISGLREDLAKAREELGLLVRDRDTAMALAKSRRGGLADVMKIVAPLLAQE